MDWTQRGTNKLQQPAKLKLQQSYHTFAILFRLCLVHSLRNDEDCRSCSWGNKRHLSSWLFVCLLEKRLSSTQMRIVCFQQTQQHMCAPNRNRCRFVASSRSWEWLAFLLAKEHSLKWLSQWWLAVSTFASSDDFFCNYNFVDSLSPSFVLGCKI